VRAEGQTGTVADWRVRCEYTFVEDGPSTDEVDQLVGGRVDHAGGGARNALGSGPWHSVLTWIFPSLTAAVDASKRLATLAVVRDVTLAPTEETRVMSPDEYQIRSSVARAGEARCPNCHQRIPIDEDNWFALEGVPVGGEARLRCSNCKFSMNWIILPEE
jgi:hypothetical protein